MASEEGIEDEKEKMVMMGSYGGVVRLIRAAKGEGQEEEDSCAATAAEEEIMLLWGIQQPTLSKPNAFVAQSSLQLKLDSCGQSLSIFQSPSSLVLLLLLLLLLLFPLILTHYFHQQKKKKKREMLVAFCHLETYAFTVRTVELKKIIRHAQGL